MSKKKLEALDIDSLCEKAWSQFTEDRKIVAEQYAHLREEIINDTTKYVVSGDTLAKYAELMLKQTGQVVELIKLVAKNKKDSSELSDDDLDFISNNISKTKEDKE